MIRGLDKVRFISNMKLQNNFYPSLKSIKYFMTVICFHRTFYNIISILYDAIDTLNKLLYIIFSMSQ